jgi:hypothetical protein
MYFPNTTLKCWDETKNVKSDFSHDAVSYRDGGARRQASETGEGKGATLIRYEEVNM